MGSTLKKKDGRACVQRDEVAVIDPDHELKINQESDPIFYNNTQKSHCSYFRLMSRPIDSHRERKYIPFKFW
ncbi:hypothetical protein YC2023_093828 [Brassica napus]